MTDSTHHTPAPAEPPPRESYPLAIGPHPDHLDQQMVAAHHHPDALLPPAGTDNPDVAGIADATET